MTPLNMLALLLLATAVSGASIPVTPCLDDCLCEQDDRNPLIRCENGDRTELELPSRPMFGYEIIALPCNNIGNLPSWEILNAAFPSLKAIDVEGNPSFNCSQLPSLSSHVVVNSDCGKDEPFSCAAHDDDECDWKCRSLEKLRKLWKQLKETIAEKAKEWGAQEKLQDVQDWFSKAFTTVQRQISA